MNDHDEEKTTERNLFVRSGKSEAELELGVLYSVEASRGLSATAELLVQCLPVIIFLLQQMDVVGHEVSTIVYRRPISYYVYRPNIICFPVKYTLQSTKFTVPFCPSVNT